MKIEEGEIEMRKRKKIVVMIKGEKIMIMVMIEKRENMKTFM